MILLQPLILFIRNSIGTVISPYTTFRHLSVDKKYKGQILFLHFLVLFYFFVLGVAKTGFRNPFLLTFKFNTLYLSFLSGFLILTLLFFIASKLFYSKNFVISQFIVLWSYSLYPTLVWFVTTSLLYFILPPPRSFSVLGKIYSLLYLSFSLTLLFWKAILYYFTLRFSLRFDLSKIILSSLIIIPSIALYSFITYKLGIFKVPFI